jgi:hypothetical protein
VEVNNGRMSGLIREDFSSGVPVFKEYRIQKGKKGDPFSTILCQTTMAETYPCMTLL